MVDSRGSRTARSSRLISVACSRQRSARSSWLNPSWRRAARRFLANCSSGFTGAMLYLQSQKLQSQCLKARQSLWRSVVDVPLGHGPQIAELGPSDRKCIRKWYFTASVAMTHNLLGMLTPDQIRKEPWGLRKDEIDTRRGKVITDAVHGDIYLLPIEIKIIDSLAFQRLRGVRQLGTTHLVYPGATHTRFAHSLGALKVAQDLLDAVLRQRWRRHGVRDLFEEWDRDPKIDLDKQVARMTMLVRLGALLHDLCHVPFGHSIEDDLAVLVPHDENRDRLNILWERLGAAREPLERDPELRAMLEPLILSKEESGSHVAATGPSEYLFAADIVGNTICADLLDYLPRDHLNLGLPFSLGTRFMSAFYVVPSDHPTAPRRMALRLYRDGQERKDIVTELLKALRYRYELTERALAHHAKLAADAMIGQALACWHEVVWVGHARETLRKKLPRARAIHTGISATKAQEIVTEKLGAKAAQRVGQEVRRDLEELFLSHGDDGLLETLRDQARELADSDANALVVDRLVTQVLGRRLWRLEGRASRGDAAAESLWKKYGESEQRRALEMEAEHYAEIANGPKIALWVPNPEMKLKLAEVLVDHGGTIDTFEQYERHGHGRGSEIYDAHRDLWNIYLYMDRGVTDSERDAALAFLAKKLGVRWIEMTRRIGVTTDTSDWPERLAALEACAKEAFDEEVESLLASAATVRGRSDDRTFSELVTIFRQLRQEA